MKKTVMILILSIFANSSAFAIPYESRGGASLFSQGYVVITGEAARVMFDGLKIEAQPSPNITPLGRNVFKSGKNYHCSVWVTEQQFSCRLKIEDFENGAIK